MTAPIRHADDQAARIGAALALFSAEFSRLETMGVVVRELPDARDTNIWILGYILEIIATASTAERFERRHFDHSRMLNHLSGHLRWLGHEITADLARDAALGFPVQKRDVGDDPAYRTAHMVRFLDLSMGLFSEMKAKGILPACCDYAALKAAHDEALSGLEMPYHVREHDHLVDLISAHAMEHHGPSAAEAVSRFRNHPKTVH